MTYAAKPSALGGHSPVLPLVAPHRLVLWSATALQAEVSYGVEEGSVDRRRGRYAVVAPHDQRYYGRRCVTV